MTARVQVAIALGSNLGDRESHLQFAVDRLASLVGPVSVSRWYETEAVGPLNPSPSPQPMFLNGALVGEASLGARDLLDTLLLIERERGRLRPFPGAPRTLDLDLILYGSETHDAHGLTVPHPRFRERRFVLEPLAEIAPNLVDPVTGLSIAELLARVD